MCRPGDSGAQCTPSDSVIINNELLPTCNYCANARRLTFKSLEIQSAIAALHIKTIIKRSDDKP